MYVQVIVSCMWVLENEKKKKTQFRHRNEIKQV